MFPFGPVRTRMCNVGLDEETPTQVEFCITVTKATKVPVAIGGLYYQSRILYYSDKSD